MEDREKVATPDAGLVEDLKRWAHWVKCETPFPKELQEVLGDGTDLEQELLGAAAALETKDAEIARCAEQYHEQITAQAREIERLNGEVARLASIVKRATPLMQEAADKLDGFRKFQAMLWSIIRENQNKTDTEGSDEGRSACRDDPSDREGGL